MYKTIVLIMILRALMVLVNYLQTKEGLGQLIGIVFTTFILIVGGVLFLRPSWHKYWIWTANFWFVVQTAYRVANASLAFDNPLYVKTSYLHNYVIQMIAYMSYFSWMSYCSFYSLLLVVSPVYIAGAYII